MRTHWIIAAVSLICVACHRNPQALPATQASTTSAPVYSKPEEVMKFITAQRALQKKAADEDYFFNTQIAQAQKVVDEISHGELTPNVEGIVTLPEAFHSLTINGNVYVTRLATGSMGVLFVNWIGKGSNLNGHQFFASGLDSLGLRTEYDNSKTIEIVGPFPDWPPHDTAKVRVHYETTRRVDWYHVVRSED